MSNLLKRQNDFFYRVCESDYIGRQKNKMSKYQPLWEYVARTNVYPLKLSFDDIFSILGFSINHSFLTYKKEATNFGFFVSKVSLKEKTVLFNDYKFLLISLLIRYIIVTK